jgi:hypothetical protein
MSLIWRRRAIARAVAGELSPAREASLRAHLARCAACRRHYDALSLVAAAAASAAGAARERARLMAALGKTAPAPRRARWPIILVPAAAAAAALLFLRPHPPDIAWRGDPTPDDRAARASLSLRVYARRKAEPVRLVGEVPGSGELHVSARDQLQLAYAGLTEPRHLVVLAIDGSRRVHRYYPRDSATTPLPPSREPRLLGAPVDASDLRGRTRLLAVVSKTPLDPAAVAAAPPKDAIEAVLWVDP